MRTANALPQQIVAWGAGAIALTIVAAAYLSHDGYRYNSTPSLPIGIWKVDQQNSAIQRGQIVSIQPPDSCIFQTARSRGYLGWGSCQYGYASLLKPVVAVAGDSVLVSADGISVNRALLPNSKAFTADSAGRRLEPMANGSYIVQPGTVWLISAHPMGFDSRYFGALPTANILGVARPVFIGGSVR